MSSEYSADNERAVDKVRRYITDNGGCGFSEILEKARVSPRTLALAIRELENGRLIEARKNPDGDRRRKEYYATPTSFPSLGPKWARIEDHCELMGITILIGFLGRDACMSILNHDRGIKISNPKVRRLVGRGLTSLVNSHLNAHADHLLRSFRATSKTDPEAEAYITTLVRLQKRADQIIGQKRVLQRHFYEPTVKFVTNQLAKSKETSLLVTRSKSIESR
jgi:hypothetical protein